MDILNISKVKELFQQGKLRGLVVLAVENGCLTRYPCVLCGEVIDKEYVGAIIFQDGEGMGHVCPDCLEAGPCGTSQRMRDEAAHLRQHAEAMEKRAPIIEALPLEAWATVDEVKAMSDAVDFEIAKYRMGESGVMPDDDADPDSNPFDDG